MCVKVELQVRNGTREVRIFGNDEARLYGSLRLVAGERRTRIDFQPSWFMFWFLVRSAIPRL